MFTKENENEIFEKVDILGKKVMQLAEGKKSFGSFFLEDYNEEVMTYLPYFQQAVWGIPMNAENTIFWEYHKFNQLDQIKNYDFAIIFKHKTGTTNDIYIESAPEYGDNKYFIVIQSQEDRDVGSMMFPFMCQFMINNPYLKK